MRRRIFVDALPLSTAHIHGVAHTTRGIIETLIHHPDLQDHEIVLVTTIRGYRFLKLWNFPRVKYFKLPLLSRIMNRLPATPLMPWMDLFLGQGVYIFTNFRSWPLLKSPSATYIHDIAYHFYPENLTPRHLRLLQTQVPRWAKRTTKIVTVSESSKREIAEYLHTDLDRIIVAYNGVDTKELYPRSVEEVTAVRQKHGLPEQYLLFFGTIEPRKNLARLVRAYTKLPAKLKQAYPLVLVGGDGWHNDDILAEIDAARAAGDRIIRPESYVTDEERAAVFTGATALVWPSVHEGFGMPPLEAMACGTPVVTSNVSSLPEVVGDAALTVDPLDEAAITKGMERILTDSALRERLIAAGHDRVKRFSWDKSLADLITWIKDQTR